MCLKKPCPTKSAISMRLAMLVAVHEEEECGLSLLPKRSEYNYSQRSSCGRPLVKSVSATDYCGEWQKGCSDLSLTSSKIFSSSRNSTSGSGYKGEVNSKVGPYLSEGSGFSSKDDKLFSPKKLTTI